MLRNVELFSVLKKVLLLRSKGNEDSSFEPLYNSFS